MLRVQVKGNRVVRLKHFAPTKHHLETLTKIVKDDLMANMSLSCEEEDGRQTSVPAFEVDVAPNLVRQLNPDMH